jgi:hypothetical protein
LVGIALRAARSRRGARSAPEAAQHASAISCEPFALKSAHTKAPAKVHISTSAAETDRRERPTVI